jgi:crooked neck
MPEIVWKAYIDFEEDEAATSADYDRVQGIYDRLVSRTHYVKVWTVYAHYELSVAGPDPSPVLDSKEVDRYSAVASVSCAHAVSDMARDDLAVYGEANERASWLLTWRAFEATHGISEDEQKVTALMPRRVTKRGRVGEDDYEEYVDWVFPGEDRRFIGQAGGFGGEGA